MTLRQIYEHIVAQFKRRCFLNFETDDELNRAANIHAIKTTASEWRRKNASK